LNTILGIFAREKKYIIVMRISKVGKMFSLQHLSRYTNLARHWWFMPVILATQEAEIRRIAVRSQPRQTVHKTLSRKNPPQNRLVEWLKV
jgi:hypothetical protein